MKICVVGLAKSGTSALYTAIKTALPDDAECVFEPRSALELEYILQSDADALTKIMFSSLKICGYDSTRFDKNVFIFRDPRDIIVSSMLYKFNRLKLTNNKAEFDRLFELFKMKEEDPASISIVDLLNSFEKSGTTNFTWKLVQNYKRLLNYVARSDDAFIVKYEDFVDNNTQELQDYLGLPIQRPDKLDGWIGKIDRKGVSGDRRHWMLPRDVEYFSTKLDGILERMNYDNDWSLAEPQIIGKEHCSEYITRLVKARRMDPNLRSPVFESIEYLLSAANDGKPIAVFRLGLKYLHGEDCDKNLPEAEKLLTRATFLEHKDANFWLGECLRQQRKYREAARYFADWAKTSSKNLIAKRATS